MKCPICNGTDSPMITKAFIDGEEITDMCAKCMLKYLNPNNNNPCA